MTQEECYFSRLVLKAGASCFLKLWFMKESRDQKKKMEKTWKNVPFLRFVL